MMEEMKGVEGHCVGGCVRKLNRMVTAIYDRALSPSGLKTTQFTIMVVVANRGKARPAELAKVLKMDESTLSRNVERMSAKGWLRLEAGTDRRSHSIELAGKGQALLRKCLPAWREAQTDITRKLGAENVAALWSALRKLPA